MFGKNKAVKEAVTLQTRCPKCRKVYSIKPGNVNRPTNCAECGETFYMNIIRTPDDENLTFTTKCPGCDTVFQIEPEDINRETTCQECGEEFTMSIPKKILENGITGGSQSEKPTSKKKKLISTGCGCLLLFVLLPIVISTIVAGFNSCEKQKSPKHSVTETTEDSCVSP